MTEEFVTAASVQYNDLLGTSAADRADHRIDRATLAGVIGLDTDTWMIASYSLYQSQGRVSISIYAANRLEHGVESYEQWAGLAHEDGSIPVTRFRVDWKGTLGEFIDLAFKRFNVKLGLKGFQLDGLHLRVEAEDNIPLRSE